ncbi:MAG TPA: hypothetical protein PLV00_05495 [Caldisericia bacterium]|nr:hypothetical protein [Caldisericia bacterium]
MNKSCIFQESYIVRFFQELSNYWTHSKTRQYGYHFSQSIQTYSQTSLFIRWMQHDYCIFTGVFRKSYVIHRFRSWFFQALSTFVKCTSKCFHASMVQHALQTLKRDVVENGVASLFSFLFAYTVLWTLLTLFFGEGLSRHLVLILFSFVILSFSLSYIRIQPRTLLKESKIWHWLTEIWL